MFAGLMLQADGPPEESNARRGDREEAGGVVRKLYGEVSQNKHAPCRRRQLLTGAAVPDGACHASSPQSLKRPHRTSCCLS